MRLKICLPKNNIMSFKSRLLNKLIKIAEKPENAFDKIIAKNKAYLPKMSEDMLCEISALRHEAAKLCRLIPYSRADIASLVESNEVSPYNTVAELENKFLIIEHIFEGFKE